MSDLSGHVLLVELLTYIFEKYGFICNTIKRVNTLEPSISDKESLITIKKSTNCGKPFKENKIFEKTYRMVRNENQEIFFLIRLKLSGVIPKYEAIYLFGVR